MIAAENYIHYYFQNSNIAIANYQDSKAINLGKNYKRFQARYNSSLPNSNPAVNEMIQLYSEMLFDNSLEKELQNIESNGVVTGSAKAGTMGKSLLGIADYLKNGTVANSVIIKQKAEELINDLGNIIKDIDSYIKELDNVLKKDYPNARKCAFKILEANNKFSSNGLSKAASKRLVDDALNKNMTLIDLGDFSDSDIALAKDYVRLKQRVEALRTLNNNKGLYSTSKTGRIIGTLVGKIGGTFSGVSGALEEIVVAKAANEILKKVGKEFIDLERDIEMVSVVTGSGDISIETKNKKMSEALKELINSAEANDSSSFNKNDVSLIVRDGQVIAIFGISVKKTNVSSGKDGVVKKNITVQTTSLKAALDKAKAEMRLTDWYIYNVASGHVNNEEGDSFSQYKTMTGVYRMWSNLVKNAIYLNFLDYLVGEGGLYSNSLLLIVNRQVYSMDSILENVTPEAISISGGLDRNKFVPVNKWVGKQAGSYRNPQEAMIRSNTLGGELDRAFSSTIVKVKLNLAMLAL